MPVFPSAQNFKIWGGNFVDNSININHSRVESHDGIDLLLAASEPDAAFDSAARNTAPRCHPGTREQYIQDFVHWAAPSDTLRTPLPLLWMKGLAGVGKTAIAQSSVEQLETQSIPFSAYFFSVKVRDKPERFFPTIAFQLSLYFHEYRNILNKRILHDKSIINKTLRVQFRKLLMEPLQEMIRGGKGIGRRFPIFVDGLDECVDQQAQQEIIEVVAMSAAHLDNPPLCWAFFSRPEPHIEATFAQPNIGALTYSITLPISRDADGEIELYLRSGLKAILRRGNMPLGYQWPYEKDIRSLVGACDGLFNYGATALRFISNPFWPGPEEPLRQILDASKTLSYTSPLSPSPFAELDALHLMILQRIPAGMLEPASLFLAYLCSPGGGGAVLRGRLGISYVCNLLALSEMEFRALCGRLNAVIILRDQHDLILADEIDPSRSFLEHDSNRRYGLPLCGFLCARLGGSISFYHKSFLDFLLSPARSGSRCVATSTACNALFKHLLDRHCAIDASYTLRSSGLVLPPGVASSASLSFPSTNEFVNSLLKAIVYDHIHGICNEMASWRTTSYDLLRRFAGLDFRKVLYLQTNLHPHGVVLPGFMVYGCRGHAKMVAGTQVWGFRGQEFAKFDVVGFKQFIERHEGAGVLHRLTHHEIAMPRAGFLSGLFTRGFGSKSIFWYWEVDLEAQSFQAVRTVDLEYGLSFFREVDFTQ